MSSKPDPLTVPFGTVIADYMTAARFDQGGYHYAGSAVQVADLTFSPAAHCLHYGSAMFEGLKAHKQPNGDVAIFRLDAHVERFRTTAAALRLPVPDTDLLKAMIIDAVKANLSEVPDPPASLYIRPTLIGTEPNIGAAATPSAEGLLYILNCPVGDYFMGGIRPLTLQVETSIPRTTPQFGMIKSGANYAMALGPTLDAKAANEAVDQVLFATNGDITETGASNFFITTDDCVITRHLDESFLHGVTRDSILTLAKDLGYEVEERAIDVVELVDRASECEAFLSGTAAVIAPVGTLIVEGEPLTVGDGQPGKTTLRLREELVNITLGHSEDVHGWRTIVEA